jgi:hypothetical protein
LHGEQLVEGVYPDKLDAGRLVDLLFRHPLKGFLHHSFRAGVAVVERVGDESTLPVQEREVYRPGVHPYALQPPCLRGGLRQPLLNLSEDAQHIPVQAVHELHWFVREAVDIRQGDVFAVKAS